MDDRFYSAKRLADLGVRGLPRTERNIHNVARREGWPKRTVPGKGGRSGTLTEYQPPAEVQRAIDEIEARRTHYRSDEAIRHAVGEAPNSDATYEAMRKVRDASDLLQRLCKELNRDLSAPIGATLLELLAGSQITEAGARRMIESLGRVLS